MIKKWLRKYLGIDKIESSNKIKYDFLSTRQDGMQNLVKSIDNQLQDVDDMSSSNRKNITGHEIQIGTVEVGLRNMESWGEMAVDLGVSPDSDSYIVIATKLHGGIVKIIPLNHEGSRNILETIKYFESRFGIKNPIKDLPRGMRNFRY